jgi:hypothetical protein
VKYSFESVRRSFHSYIFVQFIQFYNLFLVFCPFFLNSRSFHRALFPVSSVRIWLGAVRSFQAGDGVSEMLTAVPVAGRRTAQALHPADCAPRVGNGTKVD